MFFEPLSLCRRLPTYTKTVRCKFLTADGKPRQQLTIHNVDIILNPNEQLIDEFMNGYGKQRFNFKRSDLDIWKSCFKDRYNLVFGCLKGTNTIIHTSHYIMTPPLPHHKDSVHQYQGFFWVNPDYRGRDSMALAEYIIKQQLRNASQNPVAQCMPSSIRLWERMIGHKNNGHVLYVSYYKPEEMQIPDNLKLDGVFIKNATEVPDEDILKYDESVYPYERSKYILNLLRDPAGFGKVAYDENGNVIGFGTVIIYPSGECVLTPLYADNKKIAQAIFKSILNQIPLNDKKLLRFQIRSVDKCEDGYEWIQPFVKTTIQKRIMAYLCYSTHLPRINYRKVFANVPYTCSAI